MPTTPPTLNGQLIGRTHQATRAVFDRILAATGTTFAQWIALNHTVPGSPVPPATIAELLDLGLVCIADEHVARTAAGEARVAAIRAAIAASGERLYAGLTPDDLATTGRVLSLIATRAEAELG